MNRSAIQVFATVLLYGLAFYAMQLLLFRQGMVATLPTADRLAIWDGGWYSFIAREGYVYKGGWGNVGFFPLFPLVWKVTHLGPLGMSLLNIIFLAGGISILSTVLKPQLRDALIWVSTPSFYFAFVPYAEALFILLGAALMYAIYRNSRLLIWVSLLLLGLVRPVAIVLLPALLFMEILGNERGKWLQSLGKSIVLYALPLLISTAVFIWYQYYETGIWFAYYKHQAEVWGRKFAWPELPFNSALGPKMLWLNAIAMFVCMVSIVMCTKAFIAWMRNSKGFENKVLLLSFLFLSGVGTVNIFFNPHDVSGYTNVFGSHRYVLVSAFFPVFLAHFMQGRTYKPLDFVLMFLLTNIFWLCFASYLHIMTLVYFNFCTAIILLYMLHANKRLSWPALVIFAINVFVQVQGFQWFIGGVYTD